jgi:hypothetical protein
MSLFHYQGFPVRPMEPWGRGGIIIIIISSITTPYAPRVIVQPSVSAYPWQQSTIVHPQLPRIVVHYTMLSPTFSYSHCPSFLDSEICYSSVYFFITLLFVNALLIVAAPLGYLI